MSLHERFYRILLHAFPAHFRENYEDEMSRAFGELRQVQANSPATPEAMRRSP